MKKSYYYCYYFQLSLSVIIDHGIESLRSDMAMNLRQTERRRKERIRGGGGRRESGAHHCLAHK